MKIAFIARFSRSSFDEFNYLESFRRLGHDVISVDERLLTHEIVDVIDRFEPDVVLWFKFMVTEPKKLREHLRKYKTICWIFDLYWGYPREYRLSSHAAFTADIVVTTDGGHQEEFKNIGINHHCVRQGIFSRECYLSPVVKENVLPVIFVGSENGFNKDRIKQISFVFSNYRSDFQWFGRRDTNDVRGHKLNELYARSKIVVGDSVFSPYYWSNRVVETLGRGGFLIHQEVPGLKEEYPHLVTYPKGDLYELKKLIDYYLENEEERLSIIKKNFEWVRDNYLMEKQCQKVLKLVQ